MIVIGASGHAKEVIQLVEELGEKDMVFFDNVTKPKTDLFLNKYKIIHTFKEAKTHFENDNKFITAIGNNKVRHGLVNQFIKIGGKYTSIISTSTNIGDYEVSIGDGCNIMQNVFISNSVSISEGVLINQRASIHHDVSIGKYSSISPLAILLGGVTIGEHVFIGASAIILPNITISDYAIIGAGAVVTKDVQANKTVIGNPAKIIN